MIEYKTIFTDTKLSDEISNYIQMKERELFSGEIKFDILKREVKKRIEQSYEEDLFKFFNKKIIDNSPSLTSKN